MSENNNTEPIQEVPEAEPQHPVPQKSSKLVSNVHTFELEKDYTPPHWSAKPTKNYFLEIIKNGTVIGTKDLNEKPFYLVGKLQDLCDIPLEHASISRKHAMFQHKEDGTLYLYDLGSTHGVKVNKKTLIPKTFHKLNIGDVIKFGFSTRLFIVGVDGETSTKESDAQLIKEGYIHHIGPEGKDDRSTLKSKYIDLLKKTGKKKEVKKAPQGGDGGISWGMVDEDEIRAYEDEEDIRLDPDLLRELPDLTSKDYDKINDYEKKLRQYENLEKEIQNLSKKEQEEYGLTEQDKTKKENLETKANEQYSKLMMVEDNLRYSLFQEKKAKDKAALKREADTFEDDEFYDRTIKKTKTEDSSNDNKQANIAEGETFESLKKKLEDLISERQDLNEKILKLALNPELEANNQDKPKENEEEMDELDMFMKANDQKVKSESKNQLVATLRDVNSQILELEKLLKFVKPTYKVDAKAVEKQLEEKKNQPPKPVPSKTEAKSQQKTIDKIRQMVKAGPSDYPQPSEGKGPMPSEEIPKKPVAEPAKKKVYGVAAKPPSRNMREADYENPEYVDADWVPPSGHEGESI